MSTLDGVVPPGVIERGQNEYIRIVEQRQREEDAKNPPKKPEEFSFRDPNAGLMSILRAQAFAELDAYYRRHGRLPDPWPVRDDR